MNERFGVRVLVVEIGRYLRYAIARPRSRCGFPMCTARSSTWPIMKISRPFSGQPTSLESRAASGGQAAARRGPDRALRCPVSAACGWLQQSVVGLAGFRQETPCVFQKSLNRSGASCAAAHSAQTEMDASQALNIGRYDGEAHVQRFVSRRPARWPEPGASSECISNLRTAII